MRGLEAAARQVLDSHLLRDSRRPIAIALSGGGDSLALTLIADAWARDAGRELVILTVDHRLQSDSAAWTQACAALAARLAWPFEALAWEGEKPKTGLPAAARAARHRLLADAARASGARVILLGHTADDLAEAAVMRAEGATTPDPRVWSPSPVWPEGRGIFMLRPLLQAGRDELRAWLRDRNETWIDDPANADPRYARSRARLAPPAACPPAPTEAPLALAGLAVEHAGVIMIDRSQLRAEPVEAVHRFVGMAVVCAGGGERLPTSSRVARVAAALVGSAPFVGTLAGARIEARNGSVRIHRESGEAGRGGLAIMRPPGVWDGRFEIASGPEVRRLAGLAGRLTPADRAILRDIPPAARGALPAVVEADGGVRLAPLLSLVGARFRAAAGLVQREPA